jgi:hypothetical protein
LFIYCLQQQQQQQMLDPYTDSLKMDASLKAKQAAVKQVHIDGFLHSLFDGWM